mgnify:CR=1 FL=1
MKYIITESKLEESIVHYIDELFDVDDIHWTNPIEQDDETGEELVQRDDDKEDVVLDRLKVYHELTQPLIGYYKEQASKVSSLTYITVDGTAHIDEVEAAITSQIG